MYKFQISAPDGDHLSDNIYETSELAAEAFKASNKHYEQIGPTEFIDAYGSKHTIIKAISAEALQLFEVMSVLWIFSFDEMKAVSSDQGDQDMIGYKMVEFLNNLTEEKYNTLRSELLREGYINNPG